MTLLCGAYLENPYWISIRAQNGDDLLLDGVIIQDTQRRKTLEFRHNDFVTKNSTLLTHTPPFRGIALEVSIALTCLQ